jgi:hypothetical protein
MHLDEYVGLHGNRIIKAKKDFNFSCIKNDAAHTKKLQIHMMKLAQFWDITYRDIDNT